MPNNISSPDMRLVGEYTRRLAKEYRRARGIYKPGDLIAKFSTKTQLDAFLTAEQNYINEQLAFIFKGGETNV